MELEELNRWWLGGVGGGNASTFENAIWKPATVETSRNTFL